MGGDGGRDGAGRGARGHDLLRHRLHRKVVLQKNACKLTADQMGAEFKARYAEGKTKVQQAVKEKMAGKTTS